MTFLFFEFENICVILCIEEKEMATRKNARKTSSRAKSNLDVSVQIDKKSQREAQTTLKNTSIKVLLFGVLFLLVGALLGVGVCWLVCRNDCFEIVGNDEIELTLDEKYEDLGVKVVAFGRRLKSDEIVVETNLKIDADGKFYADAVGTFYIKYSTENFKYGKLFKVEKVRLVTFVEPSEGGD